jgi:uncharacterized protein YbbC (DUF1343 family)
MRVETGLDRLAAGDPAVLRLLRGRRLGLLAHPASVDRRLRHARAVIEAAGCELSALFGPEHGYGGEAQDMIAVGTERERGGLAVHSLYGPSATRSSSISRTSAAATTRSSGLRSTCCAARSRSACK